METPVLARVIRGETVESVHRGHLVAIDGNGKVLISVGDPRVVTFFRSACKPLQAIPLITSGAADAFGFTDDEIALACASHSGERFHVRVAAKMLRKAGLAERHLQCGKHLPFSDKETKRLLRANEKITQLHNNCSGKHAAMLAVARNIGADATSYLSIDHPVQQAILETISMFCEIPVKEIAIGTDGCCVPNFAMPLTAMALGILNLIAPRDDFANERIRSGSKRIISAMVKYPALIGGTGRLDTILMKAAPRKIISKVGADGGWVCGILPSDRFPKGAAVALKIEDGDDKRARPAVAIELLRSLGILSKTDLAEFSPMPIKNRRGDPVGRVEALLGLGRNKKT
jgi:L-asparaginase II